MAARARSPTRTSARARARAQTHLCQRADDDVAAHARGVQRVQAQQRAAAAVGTGAGPGHVLYLKSELTENKWRIYSDNIAMARWLQSTVQGMLNPETADQTIPVVDAEFTKNGDARDFWTERLETTEEEIALTWYRIGEPLLIHTEPYSDPARPYGVCTLLIPALGARLTRNGVDAVGQPWPRVREGKPFSTCALAFSESWTERR